MPSIPCGDFLTKRTSAHRLRLTGLGTTRNSFQDRTVLDLEYSAYTKLALQSMLTIAESIHKAHSLTAIHIIHRLGRVPIGKESILICVSAPHRTPAWRAGEDALEQVKEKVEIWKLERFGEGNGEGESVWRANRDGAAGVPIAGLDK